MTSIGIVLAAALVGVSTPAVAACDPSLTSVAPVTGAPTVDPFESGSFQSSLRLVIFNQGEACRLGLGARDPSGSQRLLSGLGVGYDLARGPQTLPPDGNPLAGSDLLIGAGQSAEVFIDLSIARPFYAAPGSGDATFDLVLFDRDDADAQVLQETVNLPVTVVSRAQANLAGTATVFGASWAVDEVDFEELETGETRTVYLQLRANVPATITVTSENLGVMRHSTRTDGASVPYTVDLLGGPASLATPLNRIAPSSGAVSGSNIPITFTVGDAGGRWAGAYRDVVTIDVTAE